MTALLIAVALLTTVSSAAGYAVGWPAGRKAHALRLLMALNGSIEEAERDIERGIEVESRTETVRGVGALRDEIERIDSNGLAD
jgi:hypothetical protein